MTEHTEKDVLMKCTKCGYEEEVPRWLIDELFPNEPEEKYMEVGNGIKEGLSAKWDEFSDWWQKTGIYNWWENHVKPWFTKEKWDEQGDGMKKDDVGGC